MHEIYSMIPFSPKLLRFNGGPLCWGLSFIDVLHTINRLIHENILMKF